MSGDKHVHLSTSAYESSNAMLVTGPPPKPVPPLEDVLMDFSTQDGDLEDRLTLFTIRFPVYNRELRTMAVQLVANEAALAEDLPDDAPWNALKRIRDFPRVMDAAQHMRGIARSALARLEQPAPGARVEAVPVVDISRLKRAAEERREHAKTCSGSYVAALQAEEAERLYHAALARLAPSEPGNDGRARS